MRISGYFFLLPLATASAFACTDAIRSDSFGDPLSTVIAAQGVIRGTVLYQGPRPCSANGHIVGSAVLLAFDRRNPPPPTGLANTAVNYTRVTGDVLFANEPRWAGTDTYCPLEHGFTDPITVSAPFTLSPLAPASYIMEAFYDYTGDFLPTFKFRNLPELGDIGGGHVDTANALLAVNQNLNYSPIFLPIDVGVPEALPKGAYPGEVPIFDMPSSGFVADNVQVSIGQALPSTRPYSYVQGLVGVPGADAPGTNIPLHDATLAQSSDVPLGSSTTGIDGPASVDIKNANYTPVLTVPQDLLTFAPPQHATMNIGFAQPETDAFEFGGPCLSNACKSLSGGKPVSGFPHLRLMWGTGSATQPVATAAPFNMQITPFGGTSGGGFNVWIDEYLGVEQFKTSDGGPPTFTPQWNPRQVPEGNLLPNFWPAVILSKLVDDPTHTADPASLQAQGSATDPVVIIQAITLPGTAAPSTSIDPDSFFGTISGFALPCLPAGSGKECGAAFLQPGTDKPTVTQQDHVTALLRPAAICFDSLFDATASDKRGVIVAPYLYNDSTDLDTSGNPAPVVTPLVPVDIIGDQKTGTCDGSVPKPNAGCACDAAGCHDLSRQQVTSLVKGPPGWSPGQTANGLGVPPAIQGCLPPGRYAVNVVYPDGQAWTIPNEAGACTGTATGEGNTNWNASPISCTIQPRPVIRSQGPRAVVEVVANNSAYCKAHPVPTQCLPKPH